MTRVKRPWIRSTAPSDTPEILNLPTAERGSSVRPCPPPFELPDLLESHQLVHFAD